MAEDSRDVEAGEGLDVGEEVTKDELDVAEKLGDGLLSGVGRLEIDCG